MPSCATAECMWASLDELGAPGAACIVWKGMVQHQACWHPCLGMCGDGTIDAGMSVMVARLPLVMVGQAHARTTNTANRVTPFPHSLFPPSFPPSLVQLSFHPSVLHAFPPFLPAPTPPSPLPVPNLSLTFLPSLTSPHTHHNDALT